MLQLCTDGEILINGARTGLHLAHRMNGTLIYSNAPGAPRRVYDMPRPRYSVTLPAGRAQLERDVLDLLASID